MRTDRIILLVRHGESHANVGLKTADPAGIMLTEQGHKQAAKLADQIDHTPDVIITSPYIRTLQTAQPLLDKFPSARHEQWPIHEFIYLCPNRCSDSTMEERIPWATEYWEKCDPHFQDGDGAESFNDFVLRALDTLDKLRKSDHNRIVMFSHMLFISSLNWLKQTTHSNIFNTAAMLNFKKYLFENSVENCQVIRYHL